MTDHPKDIAGFGLAPVKNEGEAFGEPGPRIKREPVHYSRVEIMEHLRDTVRTDGWFEIPADLAAALLADLEACCCSSPAP